MGSVDSIRKFRADRRGDIAPGEPVQIGDDKGEQRAVSVVVVAFHSIEPLRALLPNLQRARLSLLVRQVIIVNNSIEDAAEVRKLSLEFDCQVIQNNENLGYGTAANIGAAHATESFLLFLNPDVTVSSASIELLAYHARTNPKGVAFGPTLMDDGRLRSFKRVSRADPNPRPSSGSLRRKDIITTAWLSGCAMFVRSGAFHKAGGFDENIFLYYEDDDLCIRLRQQGSLYIVRDAVGLHSHGRSTVNPGKFRRLRSVCLGWSELYVMRKHRGSVGVALALLRTAFRTINPLNALSARYRAKSIHMTTGTLAALRNGDLTYGSLVEEAA